MLSRKIPWLVIAILLSSACEISSREAAEKKMKKRKKSGSDVLATATGNITTTTTASSIYINVTTIASTTQKIVKTRTSTTTILISTSVHANNPVMGQFWGEIKLAVNDAPRFVLEENLDQVLQKAIGSLATVPAAWVQILQVKLAGADAPPDSRRLQATLDVDISWRIEFPLGTGMSMTNVVDEINKKTLVETSQVFNAIMKSSSLLAGSYAVEVQWKHVHWKGSPTQKIPQTSKSDSNRSPTLAIVIVSAVSLTIILLMVWVRIRCCRKEDGEGLQNIRLPKKPASEKKFAQLGGPLAQKSYNELINPPETISQKGAEQVRQLARAMVPANGWQAKVFLTFAVGQRDTDAASCGPEMFYALAVLRFLHDHNVECFSELMLSHSKDTGQFCHLLEKSPCRVLIVLQTKALYQSLVALEEIYTAQQSKIELFPLRFEEEMPKLQNEWPQVTLSDLQGQLMLQSVQAKFSQLNSIPSPPYTVQKQPEVLKDVVVDLKLKLGVHAEGPDNSEPVLVRGSCSRTCIVAPVVIESPPDNAICKSTSTPGPGSGSEGFQTQSTYQGDQSTCESQIAQPFNGCHTGDTNACSTMANTDSMESRESSGPDRDSVSTPKSQPGLKHTTRQKKERRSGNSAHQSSKRLNPESCQSSDLARERRRTRRNGPESETTSKDSAKAHPTSPVAHPGRTKPMRSTLPPNKIGFSMEASQVHSVTRKRPKRHSLHADLKGVQLQRSRCAIRQARGGVDPQYPTRTGECKIVGVVGWSLRERQLASAVGGLAAAFAHTGRTCENYPCQP